MSDFDTDVLVVGAGPTGLTLAAELAARGVGCRIVEKAPSRSTHSRALVVQPRTLELFRAMGFADDLVAVGQHSLSINLHVRGRRVASVDIEDIGLETTPYPYLLFVSQAETERCLDAHLASLGCQIERPVELTSFKDDGSAVVAELSGPGGTETVRARYLIGCDGAHSAVRRGAGLAFEGDAYPQEFMLADVDCDWEHGHGGVHLFFGRGGVFVGLPMAGEHAYRFITARHIGKDAPTDDPTLEEVVAVGEDITGTRLPLSNPRWLARFRLHHRGVDRYSKGRVFVAGDAAHIHSPAGGQGMNTGIQDAYNLAWKLAFVVQGQASPSLLDSYHDERHPIGQFLLKFTDRLFRLGSSSNWALAQLRALVLPRVVPLIFNDRKRRARAFRFVSQLAVHYRSSSIAIEPSSTRGLGKLVRAGDRAPDADLADAGRLFDHICGPGFSVLALVAELADVGSLTRTLQEALGPWAIDTRLTFVTSTAAKVRQHVLYDAHGQAFERYGVRDRALFLIRPDGHVATRCAGLDPAPISAWFEQATNDTPS